MRVILSLMMLGFMAYGSFCLAAPAPVPAEDEFAGYELRFECTHELLPTNNPDVSLPRSGKLADLSAVITLDYDNEGETPILRGEIDSLTLYKAKFFSGMKPFHSEKNIKIQGLFGPFPRKWNLPQEGYDLQAQILPGQKSDIARIYLNTIEGTSYLVGTKGEIYDLDCKLNPM